MFESIKKFIHEITAPSHLKYNYEYFENFEAREIEHEKMKEAKDKYWEKYGGEISKFDPETGEKLEWNTCARRINNRYDKTTGELILGEIVVEVFRDSGGCSNSKRYTHRPGSCICAIENIRHRIGGGGRY